LVLPIFSLLQPTSGIVVETPWVTVTISDSVTYSFKAGQENLFGIPFSGYTASAFGSLCDAIAITQRDLFTGYAESFIMGSHIPGSPADFAIQRGRGYSILVNSDITFSIYGSIDYKYYVFEHYYQLWNPCPISVGGNLWVLLSYPSIIESTIGQLFNSLTMTPNVRVLSVAFMNANGGFDEYKFSSAINHVVDYNDAFYIKFSGATTWDPSCNQYTIPFPSIQITSPSNGYKTYNTNVYAYTTDCNGFASYVKFYRGSTYLGTDYTVDSSYRFTYYVSLLIGSNTITAKAYNIDGNEISSTSITVYRLTRDPIPR
jgi:hypothetical protein